MAEKDNHLNRVTVNFAQCGGKPCLRGMRIRVTDVLDLLASGLKPEEIILELPDLEIEDVKAAIQYAAKRLNHSVLAA